MAKKKESEPRGPYEFFGANKELFACRDREVLVAGAAGTGKSLACVAKIFLACESKLRPAIRCLIVRKTRESLTESALVTLEQKVMPERHHAMRSGGQRRLRQCYRFPNGSEIVVGGLDKPSKIMSTEYDLIYVQEATELTENDWESLLTRLRNGRFFYHQILADCNPEAPTHWLKKRCDAGKCLMLVSRHEDNPAWFNQRNLEWTEAGKRYIEKLDALSGPRLLRLRHGRWAQAEGVVYPDWNPQLSLITGFGENNLLYPPPSWRRLWGVDFGYTNPFVCHFYALDHDDRLYLYKEIYHTGRLVQDHAARMLKLWKEEAEFWAKRNRIPMDAAERMVAPEAIICDHDAEDRATLERHLGFVTTGARKYVRKGIQMLAERMRPAGDGRPRFFVLHSCTDQVDRELVEAKKPTGLVQELDGYVWNTAKDAPVKVDDHACDTARYITMHVGMGIAGLWEAPTAVDYEGRRQDSAVDPVPRLRYGEGRENRRGGRLFGGGA